MEQPKAPYNGTPYGAANPYAVDCPRCGQRAKQPCGRMTMDGFHENIRPHVDRMREAVRQYREYQRSYMGWLKERSGHVDN